MGFREDKQARTDYYFKYIHGWKERPCGACNGSGYYDNNGSPKCGACEGTGKEKYKPENDVKPKIKLLSLNHNNLNLGYALEAKNFAVFAVDLMMELFKSRKTCGYKETDVVEFLEALRNINVGDTLRIGPWSVECQELSQEEYNRLPKFYGWETPQRS